MINSHFAFRNGLPEIVSGVLQVLGNSFFATALFLLGLRIVGKGNQLRGSSGFLLPGILILVKLLVLPLVTRQTVNILHAGYNSTDTTELSTFGFLYGTFPSAPGAFVVAAQYNLDVDLIASSMVVCTFISGPLMFISAKMISLTNLDPSEYLHELDNFSFDISVTGVIACVYVISLFVMSKKVLLMPHKITVCLVVSQLLCCIGVIMWSKMEGAPRWATYMQFFLFNVGTASSRLWTALLAIALLFLQCRSLCFVLKLWPYMEKRNENLFTAIQTTAELKSNTYEKCRTLSESYFPSLKKNLDKNLQLCESVLLTGRDPSLDATLEKNRETRKRAWELFIDDMTHKCSRIDLTFEQKEEELCEFYSDLEQKLQINK